MLITSLFKKPWYYTAAVQEWLVLCIALTSPLMWKKGVKYLSSAQKIVATPVGMSGVFFSVLLFLSGQYTRLSSILFLK